MGVRANHAQKIKTNESKEKNIEGKEDEMLFALVTTSQLMVVMVGVLTAHLIWNNPPDCPEKYKKLGYVEQREVCESKYHGYGQWRWVLKE